MTIFLIICAGIVGTLIGRHAFGKWFNHVSLYTCTWSATLALFELRFIKYYTLEPETWMVITICWLLFLLGSMTPVVARFAAFGEKVYRHQEKISMYHDESMKQLTAILWCLNIISLTVALYNLYAVAKIFGGLSNALLVGNLLYKYREDLPSGIPFLSSLVFTATMLAGNYTALKGKITVVSIVPLISVIIAGLTKMGRADILMGALLFMSGYFLTPTRQMVKINRRHTTIRRFAVLFIIVALVVGSAEVIRSLRSINEQLVGSTTTLQKLSQASFITPTVYLYLTAHYGVLNQYLKHDNDNSPLGGHSFLPFYRWLENLGFEIHANPYQSWYRTPARTNTGTYLREIHDDFGIPGLIFIPYILGLLSSIFWYRTVNNRRYLDLSLTVFLYTIIGMSFFVMATRQGQLIIFLVTSLLVSFLLDRKPRN